MVDSYIYKCVWGFQANAAQTRTDHEIDTDSYLGLAAAQYS